MRFYIHVNDTRIMGQSCPSVCSILRSFQTNVHCSYRTFEPNLEERFPRFPKICDPGSLVSFQNTTSLSLQSGGNMCPRKPKTDMCTTPLVYAATFFWRIQENWCGLKFSLFLNFRDSGSGWMKNEYGFGNFSRSMINLDSPTFPSVHAYVQTSRCCRHESIYRQWMLTELPNNLC